MRKLLRVLAGLVLLVVVAVACLLAPVGYNELACRPQMQPDGYSPILPAADHRPEARTLLTYPEWHIVYAYDDYGRVIRDGDPHDYAFLPAIGDFWSSLCDLSKASGAHGGFPWETKQMVYTIGVSFTAELLAKAAYEETLGRVATGIRGSDRAPLDDLSALQASDYATFLHQVPWYKWDFPQSATELREAATTQFRDRERLFALGTEYRVKAAYAGAIAQAVAQVGADELTLRMIITGLTRQQLSGFDQVEIITEHPEGVEIETPRYAELTKLLVAMAQQNAKFVEIAGNDDIMLTAISSGPAPEGSLASFKRQGYGDTRHLVMVKVADLAETLRPLSNGPIRLEHVYDY